MTNTSQSMACCHTSQVNVSSLRSYPRLRNASNRSCETASLKMITSLVLRRYFWMCSK